MKPTELHQHHLSHDVTGTGWRVDLGNEASIRIETQRDSMSTDTKKAIAYRLAVCWNVLEGIPTDALMEGVVKRCFEAARKICDDLDQDETVIGHLRVLAKEFRDADKALQKSMSKVKCNCKPEKTP